MSSGLRETVPLESRFEALRDEAQRPAGGLRILLTAADGRPNLAAASAALGPEGDPHPIAIESISRHAALTAALDLAEVERARTSTAGLRLDLEFGSGEPLVFHASGVAVRAAQAERPVPPEPG